MLTLECRFGASYVDGYGINCECGMPRYCLWLLILHYADMPAADRLRFGIESKYSCPDTSTQLFKTAITDALHDMRDLCTHTLQSHL